MCNNTPSKPMMTQFFDVSMYTLNPMQDDSMSAPHKHIGNYLNILMSILECHSTSRLKMSLPFRCREISVRSWRWGCLVSWFCYQLIAKPGNKTAAPPQPAYFYANMTTIFWNNSASTLYRSLSYLGDNPENFIYLYLIPQWVTVTWIKW